MFAEHFGSQSNLPREVVTSILLSKTELITESRCCPSPFEGARKCFVMSLSGTYQGGVRPTNNLTGAFQSLRQSVDPLCIFSCLSIVELYMTWKDNTCKYMKAKPLQLRDFWCSQQLNHGQQTATPRRCLFLFQIPSC